jgi:hypothetical protein
MVRWARGEPLGGEQEGDVVEEDDEDEPPPIPLWTN